MTDYEVLVLGGGPAGITIAKTLDGAKDLAVMRPEDHSMVYCAMPYVIEDLLPMEKTLKEDSLVTDTGADLIRDYAVDVDFDEQVVTTGAGDKYGYEELIIATGASPVLPPVEGTDLDGVTTFKHEEDLNRILNQVDSEVEEAVVVGAGAIGIEMSQALNEAGLETHLVDMEDSILPHLLDAEMVAEGEEQLEDLGINLHLGAQIDSLNGTEKVEQVKLADDETIDFGPQGGLVVFAIGMQPNVEFVENSDLEIGQLGIKVNSKMETNLDNVYAVGDCVEYKSAITDEVTGGNLATNAVPMGRLLAQNLLGADREYEGFYNGCATKVNDLFVGGTGLLEKEAAEDYDIVVGKAEFTTAFPIMPFAKPVKAKLIINRDNLEILGGQIVSGEPATDKIDKITMAIQYGIDAEELLDFSYSSQPYQSFFPAHNLLVKAAENALSKIEN